MDEAALLQSSAANNNNTAASIQIYCGANKDDTVGGRTVLAPASVPI